MQNVQERVTVHHEEDTPEDVYRYNVEKLRAATTQTIVVLTEELLTTVGRTITDFQQALERANHVHHMDHLKAYAVGVKCSAEQFQNACEYYGRQESTLGQAQFRKFRKAWKMIADANKGEVGMGYFLFLLGPIGMTPEEFKARLKPAPTFETVADYVHPSGLQDKILLLATTQEKLDHLIFNSKLTHIGTVHELEGRVHSVADPDSKGRAQIRVKYLQENIKQDRDLSWTNAHELPSPRMNGTQTHYPVPLEGTKVRVYLTWDGEGNYVMTYGQMLFQPWPEEKSGNTHEGSPAAQNNSA